MCSQTYTPVSSDLTISLHSWSPARVICSLSKTPIAVRMGVQVISLRFCQLKPTMDLAFRVLSHWHGLCRAGDAPSLEVLKARWGWMAFMEPSSPNQSVTLPFYDLLVLRSERFLSVNFSRFPNGRTQCCFCKSKI